LGTGYPDVANFSNERRELVAANRILAAQGVVDGFGHVSARLPGHTQYFLLARSMAPALVGEADVFLYDLDGVAHPSMQANSYLERFIHCEIYRARLDIGAVVHSHSHSILPFSCVQSQTLQPIFHMSGFLGEGVSRFEIRDYIEAATDMLIKNPELGKALASALGSKSVVLMRGHGSTTVARSLRSAVYRSVYAEINAAIQISAHSLGDVTFLNMEEASCAAATVEHQIDRCWNLWLRQANG
jgi:ribulose-5-phosphate 4-epimerase/fuculose-1-phosphate aldolase